MDQSWVIGASETCDLRVTASVVSGTHCRLTHSGKGWFLEDLGSTNGTFVNGKPIRGVVEIVRSDSVTLGRACAMPWPDTNRPAAPRRSTVLLPPVGKEIVLGRSSDCDVVLPFPMISSRHAVIRHAPNGLFIRDLGSTNGTYYDGTRVVDEVAVRPGVAIGLGTHELLLTTDGMLRVPTTDAPGSTIEASGVAVEVPGRRLIGDISLVAQPGELIAIMGPSGAGKSTLLATLVGCQPPCEGRMLISGIDIYEHPDIMRGQIGYVPQDDIMHADLTVKQALWYSARLRLPADYSNDEIKARVAAVVARLGLQGTEDTRIGSAARRGISGGQRKRVNIAMELLTDPPMLVLDEPTSGLSSNDSLMLVRLLRSLAESGTTIILTIHQPSVEILKLMDGLAVVSRDASSSDVGRLVWYGPSYPAAAHFFEPSSLSQQQPEAEAVLRGLEQRTVADWLSAYEKTPTHDSWVVRRSHSTVGKTQATARRMNTLSASLSQLSVLIQRMLALKCADRTSTGVLLAQAPGIAMLIVLVLGTKATTPLDASSWLKVTNALAMTSFLAALSCIWFGCSNSIREIVAEKAIYRRERLAGVGLYSYVGSKVIVLGAVCFVQCVVLLAVVGLGCNLRGSWSSMLVVLFLAANVGVSMGLCASSVVRTTDAAATLLPILILPLIILGGALVPIRELPSPMVAVADAMPSRWAFEGIIVTEAAARPLLERVDMGRGLTTAPVEDIAEHWFPTRGWRVGRATPVGTLLGMWLVGLFALRALFKRSDA